MILRAFLFAASVAFVSLAQAQSGVLLGLREDSAPGSDKPATYRTVWLTSAGTSGKVAGSLPFLVVPRADGFWRIGTSRRKKGDWREDTIWASKVGRDPELPPLETYADTENTTDRKILFVGPDHIGVEEESAGFTQGAAHPYALARIFTQPIADPVPGPRVSLATIFGPGADAKLATATVAYREKMKPEDREAAAQDVDPSEWSLVRRQGSWIVRARLGYFAEVNRGRSWDFDLPFTAPKSLVSLDALPLAWKTLNAVVPGTSDAVASPNHNFIVVLNGDHIFGYEFTGGALIGPLFSTTLNPRESIVMSQWAVGANVARWNRAISALGH